MIFFLKKRIFQFFLVLSKKLDFLHNVIYPKNPKHIQKILTTFFRTCEIFKNFNFSIIWNERHFRKKQFLKIPIFFFSFSKILNLSENANSWKSDMFSHISNFSQYQIFFKVLTLCKTHEIFFLKIPCESLWPVLSNDVY